MTSQTAYQLVVTIISGRNLPVRSGDKVDVFIKVVVNGEKVQTEVKRCRGDVFWHCECQFLLDNLDYPLSITVNRLAKLRSSESLGFLDFNLAHLFGIQSAATPKWYRLSGKDDRYRGELMLMFDFCQQSATTLTLPLAKPNFAQKLIKFTRGNGKNRTGMSRSITVFDDLLNTDTNNLLDYTDNYRMANHARNSMAISSCTSGSSGFESNRSHLTPSLEINMENKEDWMDKQEGVDKRNSSMTWEYRNKAIAMESEQIHKEEPTRSMNFDSTTPDAMNREQLLATLQVQRRQLAQSDRRIRDLEQYLDSLLIKVMDTRPELLHVRGQHF